MAGKTTKTRNLATPAARPGASGSSLDQRDDPAPADGTTVLETKAFRTELLASLREDIGVLSDHDYCRASHAKEYNRREMEKSLSACTDDIVTLQREVAHLKAKSKLLENKCEDLEARSRRNNIRIVGMPGSQASSTGSISALLQKAFSLTEAPMLDRAHRSLATAPRQDEQPRAVVARLHYSQDCANILRLAREKQRIKMDGMTLSVYPD
ncbi:hypothetical protein MHYP_G00042890 [Metynnis hypsauchen]